MSFLLAEVTDREYFQFARLQTLTEWWQWGALALTIAAVSWYVVWMYHRDTVELPRSTAVTLGCLRFLALAGLLLFFFQLEKRSERQIVQNSRVALLADTSQSMGLRDSQPGSSSAGPSRSEQLAAELKQGPLIESLRKEHDVTVYRFDQTDAPVEVAAYTRLAPQEETGAGTVSAALAAALRESRWLAGVGVALLLIAAGGFGIHFARPRSRDEQANAWGLLVGMVASIAALVLFATANLRHPEIGPLEIVGLRLPEESTKPTDESEPDQQSSAVDFASQLAPRGTSTRVGDNLLRLIEKERGGPLAGVLLFTDGGQNAGVDSAVAARAAKDAGIPVFPIGLGSDIRPANARVVDVEAPQRVFPGDKFTLTGYLQALNLKQSQLDVELVSGPAGGDQFTLVDEQRVDVGTTGQITSVKFELQPDEKGVREYKLQLKPVPGDVQPKDDERSAKVEILDRKTKVLLIAGGPMREFIFLRNQLHRDRETEVDVWLQSARPGISQDANEVLYEFPKTAEELFAYDCIVGFDPDWEALDELQARLLDRFVAEKSGGLIVVAGPVYTPEWSARRGEDGRLNIIKALYPVIFYRLGAATIDLGNFGSERSHPIFFTRDGQQAEFLQLEDDPARSAEAWERFDGVFGYYPVREAKPGAKVFARFPDTDGESRPQTEDPNWPIYMAGHFYGSGKVFFQASGEMWRLRAVDDSYFEQYYTRLIRWAAEGRLLQNSNRGLLLVDKDRCLLGDQVTIRATLQDTDHQPLSAAEVSAAIIEPDGRRVPISLKKVKEGGRDGLYTEQFLALKEGDYKIELQHPTAPEQVLTREVRVRIPALETERPERNDALLKELADKAGGEYFVGLAAATNWEGTEVPSVVRLLKPHDETTILPGSPDRDFDRRLAAWLMGGIVGCLCAEWLLRRLSKLA
jgi:hypothetical protein